MIDDNVISEVVFAIAPYVKTEEISDIRMRITMVLSKYEIKKAVTDIVPSSQVPQDRSNNGTSGRHANNRSIETARA